MIVHIKTEKDQETGLCRAYVEGIDGCMATAPSVAEAIHLVKGLMLHVLAEEMSTKMNISPNSICFIAHTAHIPLPMVEVKNAKVESVDKPAEKPVESPSAE